MKSHFFCIGLSILVSGLFAAGAENSSRIDSLQHLLRNAHTDSVVAKQHTALAWEYAYVSLDTAMIHATAAQEHALKTRDSLLIAEAYNALGMVYLRKGSYDEASGIYRKSLAIAERNNSGHITSACYNNLGLIAKARGRYEEAIRLYLEGLKIDEQNRNEYGKASKHGNLGRLYFITNDYYNALHHDTLAFSLFKKIGNQRGAAIALNNIGLNYWQLQQFDRAEKYFRESLAINESLGNTLELSRNLTNLAALSRQRKAYSAALKLDEEALSLRKKVNDQYAISESLMNIGSDLAYLGRIQLAEEKFMESKTIAQAIGAPQLILEIYAARADANKETENFKQAYEAMSNFSRLKDSLVNLENKSIINELQVQYETEKKDRQLVEQQAEVSRQKSLMFWIFLTGGGITFSLILILVLIQQRRKLLRNKLIAAESDRKILRMRALVEGEERERSRLARELHDGVNGSISAIKLLANDKEGKENAGKISSMLDEVSHEVREISHNLMPGVLLKFGLKDALETYLEKVSRTHSTDIDFQYYGTEKIEMPTATHLYRIVQELVSNVIRHAQARECIVQINQHADRLNLVIEDDGCGFDIYAEGKKNHKDGIGITSVFSRVEILGGNMNIKSKIGAGTGIEIEIPLKLKK